MRWPRELLIKKLRMTDLHKLSKAELDSICQALGVSARGMAKELVARIEVVIRRGK